MHRLVVGITESGKTSLVKKFLSETKRLAVIYDPLGSEWSENCTAFHDERGFFEGLERLAVSGGGYVVVDEADTLLSMAHKHNHWLLQRGRHYGFSVFVVTQRPALVAPTVRGMCGECYAFNISRKDAKLLADDYNAPELLKATNLPQGSFVRAYWSNKKRVAEIAKIF